jgi:hypothetical protein
MLSAGIEVSRYLQTEDTGARHEGKNGYCTYIGNELFAWFKSTQSKSWINFWSCCGQTIRIMWSMWGRWSIGSIRVTEGQDRLIRKPRWQ